MSSDLNLNRINFQNALRSKPVRENFIDIENEFNLLRAEVYASIASTSSEVTTARGGYGSLVENINARYSAGYGVNTGGIVTPQGTPNNTVHYSTGYGVCPDGSGVKWNGGNSSAISVVTKPRYGVSVINSDSSFSIEWGATATNPVYPDLINSQLPLATIYQNTANPPIFNSEKIYDARNQYVLVNNEKYFWKIQDAINFYGNTGSDIFVSKGTYREDITYKNNTKINFSCGSILYNTIGAIVSATTTDLSSKTNAQIIKGNSESVSNDKQIRGSVKYNSPIIINNTIKAVNIFSGGNKTQDDLYLAITSFIVSIGDKIIVNGGISIITSGGDRHVFVATYAERISSTQIILYGVNTRNETDPIIANLGDSTLLYPSSIPATGNIVIITW